MQYVSNFSLHDFEVLFVSFSVEYYSWLKRQCLTVNHNALKDSKGPLAGLMSFMSTWETERIVIVRRWTSATGQYSRSAVLYSYTSGVPRVLPRGLLSSQTLERYPSKIQPGMLSLSLSLSLAPLAFPLAFHPVSLLFLCFACIRNQLRRSIKVMKTAMRSRRLYSQHPY